MPDIRTMAAADIPLGMRLKGVAGWNQTRTDWERFLTLSPEGCFVASADGCDVGTAATFTFGRVAWIAMVLVDPAARGKGVGTALMGHSLAHLDAAGVPSVRLDATPLGKPIYRKLGFVEQFELARYEGLLPAASHVDTGVVTLTPADVDACIALDQAVTNTPRGELLRRLFHDGGDSARCMHRDGRLAGFVTHRPGENAYQLGPCIAEPDVGVALLDAAAASLAGKRVFVDIALDNQPAVDWAARMGLAVQRPLTRMCRGDLVNDDISRLFASTGPEKG